MNFALALLFDICHDRDGAGWARLWLGRLGAKSHFCPKFDPGFRVAESIIDYRGMKLFCSFPARMIPRNVTAPRPCVVEAVDMMTALSRFPLPEQQPRREETNTHREGLQKRKLFHPRRTGAQFNGRKKSSKPFLCNFLSLM